MDTFSSTPLWNDSAIWDTNNSDLTPCFYQTILFWLPSIFLWTRFVFNLLLTTEENIPHPPWTTVVKIRFLLAAVLALSNVIDLLRVIIDPSYGVSMTLVVSPFLESTTLALGFLLTAQNRSNSMKMSGTLWLFWFLYSASCTITCRSLIMQDVSGEKSWPTLVEKIFYWKKLFCLPLVLVSFSSCWFRGSNIPNQSKISPETGALFQPAILFRWVNTLIRSGLGRLLLQENLYNLPPENSASVIAKNFEKYWTSMVTPKITLPLFRAYLWKILSIWFLELVFTIVIFICPILLDHLLIWMKTREYLWHGIFYAMLMFLGSFLDAIVSSSTDYLKSLVAMNMQTTLTDVIYKKSLKLSPQSRIDYPTGKIVNLASLDVEKIALFMTMIDYVWSAPAKMVIAIYLLWRQLNIAAIVGITCMILLIPINSYLVSKSRLSNVSIMSQKDNRSKVMSELLAGIRVIKLYGWETSFSDQVKNIRMREITQLRIQAFIISVIDGVLLIAPMIVAVLSFITFILIDKNHQLDASKAFVSLSLFHILEMPLSDMPWVFSLTTQFSVCMERVNEFLNCEESDDGNIEIGDKDSNRGNSEDNAISIKNGNFSWTKNENNNLEDINIDIPRHKLVAIVGKVGSGKSSILSSILGDMYKLNGEVSVSGSIGYVSQQAWIQNVTLKENVVFTSDYDQDKFDKIIKATALEDDIKTLPAGVDTEIGERGINLSGGQKQRVAIARAIYADPDIYLLDDPLSAVDSHVGKHIFDNVISSSSGLLKDKTRVLVTHKISLLPKVDKIIVVKDGRVSECGTYHELLDKKGAFAEFLVEFWDNVNADDDPDLDSSIIEEVKEKLAPELERHFSENSDGIIERQTSRLLSTQSSNRDAKTDSTEVDISTSEGKLIDEEMEQVGSISWSISGDYIRAAGTAPMILVLIFASIYYGLKTGSNFWLSAWASDANHPERYNDTSLRNLRIGVYGAIGLLSGIFFFAFRFLFCIAATNAAKRIHNLMIDRLLRSPMRLFDTTPVGRIMSRFTEDVDTLDSELINNIIEFLYSIFNAVVAIFVVGIQTPWILLALLPLGVIYFLIQRYYIPTLRQLKRIEANTKSPIYSHFTESINGSSTIRAFSATSRFRSKCHAKIDQNVQSVILSIASSRQLAIRLEFVGSLIVLITALLAVTSNTLGAAMAGLTISYALRITNELNRLVSMTAELENNLVSAERCLEYTKLESEADWYNQGSNLDHGWPDKGVISFQNYSTRYRDDLDLVLKSVSFETKCCERVGIVGRTGAGKSSLTLSLLRLIEPVDGKIMIDGVDITNIGLMDLRTRLTIIPQDPFLFTGTLRKNLDPFGSHQDSEIWTALELSHLKEFVLRLASSKENEETDKEGASDGLSSGLDHEITEGGDNLSVGQRQLVCLTRALLRKSKILILDEATAAVDMETDALIQTTIRTQFKDCTILTIAHRLNTVLDYDRIVVLDQGRVVEFDSPSALLSNSESLFYSLAKDAQIATVT